MSGCGELMAARHSHTRTAEEPEDENTSILQQTRNAKRTKRSQTRSRGEERCEDVKKLPKNRIFTSHTWFDKTKILLGTERG